MAKAVRVVEMKRSPRRGGRPRTWGYGYTELAALFGMSEGAVRQAVRRESLDAGDLRNVVAFANERAKKEQR